MKPLLMAVATAAALVAPLASAQKIGVTMATFDDIFLNILRNSMADAARKAGASVQIEDAGSDVGKQLSQIQNMIAQKVDAVIVNAVDTDATPKMTRLLTEARIPLVYVNRKPADFEKLPASVVMVASDEMAAGRLQAEQVCKLLGGKGSILVLMGDLSNESTRSRTKAVDDVVAGKECSGISIADRREGKWSRTRGQDITINWLSSGLKFDAIVSNDDEMALGAINALKATKKWTPRTIVAGIDATPDALASMKAGDLKVTVFQNAAGQGAGAIDAAIRLSGKQSVERFVNIPFELVTPGNMARYAGKN
ncbi:sugar ABC transporter substrate-binding protein [Verminephrobacter eiseniae]|uniref:Periplasmic binding protein/LacI transcriptional regulator n=1 Tax=Verminephrobacter eiseniae (strain EF01-2) TaxID=391735 RepID=A1WDZ9_VEREI|nr:sugar ABC transporter substrate-binding protein [Verminephrobacter eiseniae]ABM55856.1 periplasmic binding protein/LacI transcriptional regulator [Verminephrobacter eiseniae EF01-2]MCW5232902.1 sugar ABC transporter substrate-binding protein [Verminephrobacter eiseniae]MCW5261070.1 sugar ABC transporter substrate-binding protein [Verminephrobacter eiseniae]MCW5286236.1 sugar ABC transporter substrate-binding protein [Verminephrobacter eiseniae]MCW5304535.1 sugar ABC transporter substrate-bi